MAGLHSKGYARRRKAMLREVNLYRAGWAVLAVLGLVLGLVTCQAGSMAGGATGDGPCVYKLYADSIGEGDYRQAGPGGDSWVQPLRARIAAAGLDVTIDNHSEGGLPLHSPAGSRTVRVNALSDLRNNPAPCGIIVAAGFNDLVTHDSSTLYQSMYALIDIDVAAERAGVANRIYLPVQPFCTGTAALPAGWDAALQARRTQWNDWLRAMWGPTGPATGVTRLADIAPFPVDGAGHPDCSLFLDGLHPTVAGYAAYASSFPLGVLAH